MDDAELARTHLDLIRCVRTPATSHVAVPCGLLLTNSQSWSRLTRHIEIRTVHLGPHVSVIQRRFLANPMDHLMIFFYWFFFHSSYLVI